jgi:trk system potassium uptake protein TrkA
LKDLDFPEDGIIGTITRGEEIIIPTGDTTIEPGDEVIVFALPGAIKEIESWFA